MRFDLDYSQGAGLAHVAQSDSHTGCGAHDVLCVSVDDCARTHAKRHVHLMRLESACGAAFGGAAGRLRWLDSSYYYRSWIWSCRLTTVLCLSSLYPHPVVILDAGAARDATKAILATHGIPTDRSPDLEADQAAAAAAAAGKGQGKAAARRGGGALPL